MSPTPDATERQARQRFGVLLFCGAFLLRLLVLLVLRWYETPAGQTPWEWGFEAGNLGSSLARGQGFADPWLRLGAPFDQPTGATGWLTPAYPALVGGLVRLFGEGSMGMAAALLALQSLLSSVTCVLLWRIGEAAGFARAGRWAGWILALHPYSIWSAAHTIWDTTLVAFAWCAFLLLALRLPRAASMWQVARLGVAYGALLLVNAALLSGLPLLAWWVGRTRLAWSERARVCLVAGLAALAVCLPWLLRNQRELGAFSLRTNLGVELCVGNHDQALGYFEKRLHPSYSPAEFARYRELGEVAYEREASGRALDWARAHPARFAGLCLRRVQLYWFGDPPALDPRGDEAGLGAETDPASWLKWAFHFAVGVLGLAGMLRLVGRSPGGALIVGWALVFPLPYYLTHVLERYRFPSEPLLVLGAAAALLFVAERRARALS